MKLPDIGAVDLNSGEIYGKYSVVIKGERTSFVLAFVSNLTTLYGLNVQHDLLNEMLKDMNNANIITLNSYWKKKTKIKIKLSISRTEYWIAQFCDQNILTKIDRATYIVNPYLWGKGSIEKIRKLRIQYDGVKQNELSITYEREP